MRPLSATVVVPTRDRPGQLAACLAAIERQTAERQTTSSFEIVVVDDGSLDAAAVAAVVDDTPRARLVPGGGRGPAAARNLGVAATDTDAVAFVDDDCRPDAGWLDALLGAIEAGADVVAGPTVNGRPANDPFARASQTVTNHLMDTSLVRDQEDVGVDGGENGGASGGGPSAGHLGFAPTSNVACRIEVHRSLPFDETYPSAAGEDRDWCARIAARGIPVRFVPTATVFHHQELTFRGFWRQQMRYGRGAHRFRKRQGTTPSADRTDRGLQPAGFYTGLVRKGFAQGVAAGLLVLVAQVATATGIARERWGH